MWKRMTPVNLDPSLRQYALQYSQNGSGQKPMWGCIRVQTLHMMLDKDIFTHKILDKGWHKPWTIQVNLTFEQYFDIIGVWQHYAGTLEQTCNVARRGILYVSFLWKWWIFTINSIEKTLTGILTEFLTPWPKRSLTYQSCQI